jgi:hypothetical protein
MKQIYLDSIGTKHKQRYNELRGLEWAYVFNGNTNTSDGGGSAGGKVGRFCPAVMLLD